MAIFLIYTGSRTEGPTRVISFVLAAVMALSAIALIVITAVRDRRAARKT